MLHLERRMPGGTMAVQDRHADWTILLDGQVVGHVGHNEDFESEVPLGSHTLQLTSTGRRRSPARTFTAAEESIVGFHCHSQPIWPLMVMALVVPGRWIALKRD